MPPILHADADSFFASVVLRSHPALRSEPLAVVVHGFVASSNYPARARGVTGGMLVTDALRRCPELALFDVPQGEVEETADALFDLFAASAAAVEPGSMEEAFLEVGAPDDRAAVRAATELRRRAWQELRIPVSVGVGRTKLMAKLASRAAKPDGLHVIDAETERGLRSTLPVAKVWGVGRQTLERLEALGVRRLGDLDGVLPERLLDACGTMMTRRLLGIRDGGDDATVRPVSGRTLLSSEGAIAGYARRDWTVDELVETCIRRVCKRAMRAGLAATGLTIVLRGETAELATVQATGRAVVLATVKAVVPTPTPADDPSLWMRLARAELAALPEHAVADAGSVKASLTGLRPLAGIPPTLF
ncbi:DNA polymerase IV [Herbiconiux sp. VKM Ac-2851]|uniref:Y-family DNA polymerase n=1 Tax=Herbiconiux sp. VKM Ac-2851 TaxID=2739025 RepID=UPI00156738C0|nr:DNA polymerase IV [Herbiconiux sp. VKM Ac-2851]